MSLIWMSWNASEARRKKSLAKACWLQLQITTQASIFIFAIIGRAKFRGSSLTCRHLPNLTVAWDSHQLSGIRSRLPQCLQNIICIRCVAFVGWSGFAKSFPNKEAITHLQHSFQAKCAARRRFNTNDHDAMWRIRRKKNPIFVARFRTKSSIVIDY